MCAPQLVSLSCQYPVYSVACVRVTPQNRAKTGSHFFVPRTDVLATCSDMLRCCFRLLSQITALL